MTPWGRANRPEQKTSRTESGGRAKQWAGSRDQNPLASGRGRIFFLTSLFIELIEGSSERRRLRQQSSKIRNHAKFLLKTVGSSWDSVNRPRKARTIVAGATICGYGSDRKAESRRKLNMAGASIPKDRVSARIAVVEQHIRLENEHDIEGVLRTFGDSARYDDEPWDEHYTGQNGVRLFYEQLMKALPDLEIEVQHRHVTDDAILLEVMIRGTHIGAWRGLPATGRSVEFPLCGVYTFDPDDRLAGERIYYDRGTVLRQLGVFHEPQSILGQISILATHPTTIVRALARMLLRR